MTPQEFDAYLAVAQARGCTRIRVGEVEAELAPAPRAAAAPVAPAPQSAPKDAVEHWDRIDRELHEGVPA